MYRKESRPYRAYLLRCWQGRESSPGQEPRWRFSVEHILQQRSRQGFDSLEALVAFLQAELAGCGDEPAHRRAEGAATDGDDG
jgi:hypothetical protein